MGGRRWAAEGWSGKGVENILYIVIYSTKI